MSEKKGIDVSHWNGIVDWEKVKADGIAFAIIRVGSSTNLDRQFVANIEGAHRAGLACGVYHYSYAVTPEQAREEAKFVTKTIAPYTLAYPVMYDIEDAVQIPLSTTQKTDLVCAFCDEIKRVGYRAGVYASLSWMNHMLELERLSDLDKWVAQWNTKKCGFAQELAMWQYSNKGEVAGIAGDVDMNIVYRDYEFSPVAPVKPTPPSKPTAVVKPVRVPPIPRAGTRVELYSAALYATARSIQKSGSISGSYWVYDGEAINGRLRITTSTRNVSRLPVSKYVSGFVDAADLVKRKPMP